MRWQWALVMLAWLCEACDLPGLLHRVPAAAEIGGCWICGPSAQTGTVYGMAPRCSKAPSWAAVPWIQH